MGNRKVLGVRGRPFAISLPPAALTSIQQGVLRTTHGGLAFLKNPFDLYLYQRLIAQLSPRSIIEIGSYQGGSALWFSQQAKALGLSCTVLSIDLHPPRCVFSGVTFVGGNAAAAGETFPHSLIEQLPHPWLVIEDSAHTFATTIGSLRYFQDRLEKGDYLVVEDGCVADLQGVEYDELEDGPNLAVAEFLETTSDMYEIDTQYCDYYGHNVTYCPNAWLRRV
jgi:cephalosporin hydroxylase